MVTEYVPTCSSKVGVIVIVDGGGKVVKTVVYVNIELTVPVLKFAGDEIIFVE